jgi:hypothetical protein
MMKKPVIKNRAAALLVIVFILMVTGCAKPRLNKPQGFAQVKGGVLSEPVYRAVSPEGMLLRVRSVKNYPYMGLEFWGDSLKNQLTNEGYHLSGDRVSFNSGKSDGILYEWILPFGEEDYIYMTAIMLSRRRIIIAESAAEHSVYKKYRESILESLKTVSLGVF